MRFALPTKSPGDVAPKMLALAARCVASAALAATLAGTLASAALFAAPTTLAAQSGATGAGTDADATAAAATGAPEVGPPNGTVVVVGGGEIGPRVWGAFIEAAGGPDALIVDVPNAAGGDAYDQNAPGAQRLRAAGARNVRVLFTTDRDVADSDTFVAALQTAGGVWFDGGRQYRLVDAYGGTRTEQGFHDVLARGGVVGGSSAGATILGDFLVRGAPSNDNGIMDYPGYHHAFAFLRGTAIDQHVVARERLPDLADSIMPRYPQMLGMSEDEGTAWVVRGDTAAIVGRNKAFVYGGEETDPGKPFLTLYPGDRYDLGARRVLHRAIDDSPLTKAFVDSLFAPYAGSGRRAATVLAAQDGEVFIDASYGVPDQERFMPTTTLPQFDLGDVAGIFTGLCDQIPAPEPPPGVGGDAPAAGTPPSGTPASARARAAADRWRAMSPFQRCFAREIAPPVGLHRTEAEPDGTVRSDVDELYRVALGLEDPKIWPGADRSQGWHASGSGANRLAAYGTPDGRRAAFLRIPDHHAVVIVLTNDDDANARSLAEAIAARMLAGR